MGVGMVLVCSPERVREVEAKVPEARTIGEVVRQRGTERALIEP
jgi:phosphoribosylaminoimidazole (AIR) synthetase